MKALEPKVDAFSSGPAARDVIIGRDPDILADIRDPGIAAAIWRRTPDPEFQKWMNALPKGNLPDLRTVVPVHLAEAAVRAACESHGIPACRETDMLASDVGALALMLAKTLTVRLLRLRLDVSDDVMCPKFHLDNVRARLLCTYRGPGTEYVPENVAEETVRIRQVPLGGVAVFRGRQWSCGERTALLHWSPAATPAGGPRLLLVIDPAD
ncbi:hypothetical protein ACP90_09715 [Labrenzia sp. CP4]|jgi:hypothetical protein|uniref:DUF1826 domain-containing protein n=1 Tax=Labrenzia sp. CP4 TaxID=1674922 RepID=UPI00078061F7|nr:DUF1826 domain-containing protein [Labrenzia sp. CP4]AMN52652.1 hypothetical protein ACP90_09715 [Labrenzia sp. CP4]